MKRWLCSGVGVVSVLVGWAGVALAQVQTEVPGGNLRSYGAVVPQQGPIDRESATAIDKALDSPAANADAGDGPRKQVETQREWMRLRQQERGHISGRNNTVDSAAPISSQWRYARANNHWWYWLPSNKWVFYHNNRWVPYDAKTYGKYYPTASTAANPPMVTPTSPPYSKSDKAVVGGSVDNPVGNAARQAAGEELDARPGTAIGTGQ